MNRLLGVFLALWGGLAVGDDAVAENGNAYVGTIVVDAWSGARSAAQLWNPPDSGVVLYLDTIHVTHSKNEPSGFDLRAYSDAYGTFKHYGVNKLLNGPESAGEIRWGNSGGHQYGGTIIYEMWTGSKFNDHPYTFSPPIIIPPGSGVVVASAHDSVYLVVSFQYREKAVH